MTAQAQTQASGRALRDKRDALAKLLRQAYGEIQRCRNGSGACQSCEAQLAAVMDAADDYAEAADREPLTVKPSDDVPRELAAAMAESRQYRELLTEILATFGTPAQPGTVRWTARQVAGWRKRAGLEA